MTPLPPPILPPHLAPPSYPPPLSSRPPPPLLMPTPLIHPFPPKLQEALYRGPLDVARHVIKHEGGVPGLFKGLGATLTREVSSSMGREGLEGGP